MTTTPCSAEASGILEHWPSRIKLPLLPARLLVADDQEEASGLKSDLAGLGYTVIGPVSRGDEAIETCRTAQPDLALVDIRVPMPGGPDVAEAIWRHTGVPVVIVSASSKPHDVAGAAQAGALAYLVKPVTREQLQASIAVAWARFRDHAVQETEIRSLKQRLDDRKQIEQAKWIIVKRKGVSEPDAMKLLQKQARNNRRPLIEVARSILENESIFAEE